MATVNESTKSFSDDNVSVTFCFYLLPKDEENNAVAKRLRVTVSLPVDRDDGRPGSHRDWTSRIADNAIARFSAGDSAALRALLGKLHNEAKDDLGL